DARAPPRPAPRVPQERDPGRRLRAPGGHVPVRQRPGDVGARHHLPRARGRQPLRRRHQLLPEHRRGEPGADRDGQWAARRRPSAGAARMTYGNGQKHVVVVGGGFAGVGAARRLAEERAVRVTLVDRNNYHQFQPLLYQVATSQLAPSDVAFSLRKLFADNPNVDVKLAEVASVDAATHTVTTSAGDRFSGDAIVLAAGSQPNFFP